MTYRVSYADTDKMGVVYYANHLVLFERGRTELLRDLGSCYRDVEEKLGVCLPVREAHCEFMAPARYDDLLKIKTTVAEMSRSSVTFRYEIENAETGRLLARGHTSHVFVDMRAWKPTRVPESLKTLLEKAR